MFQDEPAAVRIRTAPQRIDCASLEKGEPDRRTRCDGKRSSKAVHACRAGKLLPWEVRVGEGEVAAAHVPLGTSVVSALLAIRSRSAYTGADDLVFASGNGTPLNENNLRNPYLKAVGERLGMPWLGWHVFRHTHATLGEQIGMAQSDRPAPMGHGEVRMTMHYTPCGPQRPARCRRGHRRKMLADDAGNVASQPVLTLFDTKPGMRVCK